MDIKLVISADESALEFSRNLAAAFAGGADVDITANVQTVVQSAVETKEEEGATAKSTPAPVKATAEPVQPEKQAGALTIEKVRAAAAKVKDSNPRRLAEAIQHFNIKKVPDLKPDQFQEFVEFLNA